MFKEKADEKNGENQKDKGHSVIFWIFTLII